MEAKAQTAKDLQSKLAIAEEALKQAQDKVATMKDKIEQIDAREAALIERFDTQSEKFGGKLSLSTGLALLWFHSGCADRPCFCSRKDRGEIHQKFGT